MKPTIKIFYYFNDESNIHILSMSFIISVVIKLIAYICQADWTALAYNDFSKSFSLVERDDSRTRADTPLTKWIENGCKDIVYEECEQLEDYQNKVQYIKEKTSLLYFEGEENKVCYCITEPSSEMDITI